MMPVPVAGLVLLALARPPAPTPAGGSFFVTLGDDAPRGLVRAWIEASGGRVRYEYTLAPGRWNVRGLPPGLERLLERQPGVVRVVPDGEVRALLTEGVPLVGALATNPAMFNTDGGLGIRVCILDSGIDPFHMQFDTDNNVETPTTRIAAWKDFIFDEPTPYDDFGHGTHVAGTALGRTGVLLSGKPLQGMAPRATPYIGKVLNANGVGLLSDVQAAVEWCAGEGPGAPAVPADVISLSLGGGLFSDFCDADDVTGTAATVTAAAAADILVVAAAGNAVTVNAVSTPACASGALAVGATYDAALGARSFPVCADPVTGADLHACFSNRWDHLSVVAPGCRTHAASILSPTLFIPVCGTSMAAAMVSGLGALVEAANRTFTAAQVRERIESGAVDLGKPGPDRAHGHGRIDAAAAVVGPTCAVLETPEMSCADALDNDCDGVADCADADCCSAAACAGADADGDGFAACDCAEGNAAVWLKPGAARDLMLVPDGAATRLDWLPPETPGAITVRHDVIRSGAPNDFVTAAIAVCLESDDAADTTALEGAAPAPGQVFFYRVRSENACPLGVGPLGEDSDGVPASGRACP